MKQYPVSKIRNICLLAHGGAGKTSLAEAALFLTKGTDRLGKIADGNTVCDYDPEEIRRQVSISTAMAPVEWEGEYKINFIDTPGYFDFVGEVLQGVRVADGAVILVPAKTGIEVGTEKSWKYSNDRKLPRAFFVTKLDEENADFSRTADSLREQFGQSVFPVIIPIDGKTDEFINIIDKCAYRYDKAGNAQKTDVPASMSAKVEAYSAALGEAIAMTDEELMEKYLGGEAFTPEEMERGIRGGVLSGGIVPVMCGSAVTLAGVRGLLECIVKYFPSPEDVGSLQAETPAGDKIELKPDPSEPAAALIFKTIADPFVGKMSFFKVFSGEIRSDATLLNTRANVTERASHIFVVRGKKQSEEQIIGCGDIGVVTKLASANTGDTLCAPQRPVVIEPINFPEPCLSMAIVPKARGDEEKISGGLQRLVEEDLTFSYVNNGETRQMVISGMGEMHIDVISTKLKNKFGVSVDLKEPKVAFRETIRKKVKVEGKHKKQSGGHGQFGHVWIEFEHCDDGDFIFEEKVFGGAVPKNYFPAVEKGLREAVVRGVLAGYPVVNLKATLVDGSYHPVDSSEMSFKIAASLAYKAGLAQASPVLLEPIGSLKTYVPDGLMGDIIGDINKRRGRMLGMNSIGDGYTEIEAEVPMMEMTDYATALRSVTQGRGWFKLSFARYEDAPANISQKVIEQAKLEAQDEEEE